MMKLVEIAEALDTGEMLELIDQIREDIVNGEVRGFGYAAITKDKKIKTGWQTTASGYHSSILGALDYLKHRMHCDMDKED